ncbi:RNA exonuclease 1 homolog isoform X2 [Oscarella lobularis]|uniref:RNA exonuclease 1 homolog isoform X2 n=1 Tax=Oscarella lobularis TaxID=121494 RepID=UPI003314312C
MFPSAGFFRAVDCPFYAHGLCHRPYCHYKHTPRAARPRSPKQAPLVQHPAKPVATDRSAPETPQLEKLKSTDSAVHSSPKKRNSSEVTQPKIVSKCDSPRKGDSASTSEPKKDEKIAESKTAPAQEKKSEKLEKPPEPLFNIGEEDDVEDDLSATVDKVLSAYSLPPFPLPKQPEAPSVSSPSSDSRNVQSKKEAYQNIPGARIRKRIAHAGATVLSTNDKKRRKMPPVEHAPTVGRKRVAHTAPTAKRPVIPLKAGGKIPSNLRQTRLDSFVNEFLKLCSKEEEAFERAKKEEESIFLSSSTRQLYVGKCSGALNKLRRQQAAQKRDTEEISYEPNDQDGSSSVPVEKRGDLTSELFYKGLQPYLLTEEQLRENGYPLSHESNPTVAKIDEDASRRLPNPVTTLSNTDKEHICVRCSKRFVITTDYRYATEEECNYHKGRLWTKRDGGTVVKAYSCCQAPPGASGCLIAKCHVTEGVRSPLRDGFVTTNPSSSSKRDHRSGIFALDCEMCYTANGLELTRVTVIDHALKSVYETLVRPQLPIVDYNTQFSGITASMMEKVKTSLTDVQRDLMQIFTADSILIGHSLNSDLVTLKIIHAKVVDTSVVFPHAKGRPYKRALRTLAAEFLNKIIQDSAEGHDSLEDSVVCMEIMRQRVEDDLKKEKRKSKAKVKMKGTDLAV